MWTWACAKTISKLSEITSAHQGGLLLHSVQRFKLRLRGRSGEAMATEPESGEIGYGEQSGLLPMLLDLPVYVFLES